MSGFSRRRSASCGRCRFFVSLASEKAIDILPISQAKADCRSVIRLPLGFVYERLFVSRKKQTPFVREASLFEDFVIRCVRYAFARIPAKIGRVFFSKPVALPFLLFRMLRYGYLKSPIHWREHRDVRCHSRHLRRPFAG
jgi:hypothetical protein